MGGNPNGLAGGGSTPPPSSAGGGPAPPWTTDGGMQQPAHGGGAWQDQNGSWVWVVGSDPDPNLESAWGSETLTDPTRNPNGVPNSGAWLFSGHSQVWVWGAVPDPNEVAKFGEGALTNPNFYPNGTPVPGSPGNTAPPDVTPPIVTDTWGGAPELTGNVPDMGPEANNGNPNMPNVGADASQNIGQDGQKPPANQPPPSHPAYSVSPGAIRDQESWLLNQIDIHIGVYDNLKNQVYQAVTSGNLATDPNTYENLHNTMDNLLENYADVITAMGGMTNQLNSAGQNYAHADISSALPQS